MYHRDWFGDVEEMCREVGTEPVIPRRCGKQHHHANTPAKTATDYYKRVITIPLLDHVLMELNTRFDTHQIQAIQGLCLVPVTLVALTPDDAKQKLKSLTSLYRDDLPFPGCVESEFHC